MKYLKYKKCNPYVPFMECCFFRFCLFDSMVKENENIEKQCDKEGHTNLTDEGGHHLSLRIPSESK
jgi:hypothetical protein